MLKIQGPPIKTLNYLLEINDFSGFCDEYENKKKYLQNDDMSYDVANIENPEIALPYIKFLLSKKREAYKIVLLEYLVKHNFTKEVIDFLESIKDVVVYVYDNPSVNIIKSICKNKNMECFIYLVKNSPSSLPEFKDNDLIFKEIIKHNFSEGIEYLSQKIENIHLYLIDDIIKKRSFNKEAEINWDFYFHYMKIDENLISREQLKQSILDYAQSQYEINPNKIIVARMPDNSSSITTNSASGIEPLRNSFADFSKDYFNNGLSKPNIPWHSLPMTPLFNDSKIEYADHKKDNVSQSIWLNEKLNNSLNIKINNKTIIKI